MPESASSLEIKLMTTFNLHAATAGAVPTLHRLMRDFAVHGRAQERFQITEADLHTALFAPNHRFTACIIPARVAFAMLSILDCGFGVEKLKNRRCERYQR